ncbi:MAG: hypothetical protein EPO63_08395, partial [Candidatus Nitrosotenuis sp.]
QTKFAAGHSYPVLLELVIGKGFHINSSKPLEPALIPTTVTFSTSDPAVTVGRVTFPNPIMKKFKFAKDALSVYEGTVYVAASISFTEGAKEPLTVTAHLQYQACTDFACMIPIEADIAAPLALGTDGQPLEAELFSRHAAHASGASASPSLDALKGGLGPMALLLVFISGLGLTLTPCVYPLIPVTIGFFGAATGRSRGVTVAHALVYLLGMALMYSALGVAAALTGSLFGQMMQNPIVVVLLVAVMLALAASMFGAFEIVVPAALMQLGTKSYAGYFGTFVMGLTVGIMAAPCVGPFVIGLLTFVSERQSPLLGFTLFFTLALGLGMPFVFLAIFSGSLQKLPRSGVWMVWVRKMFGVVLLGMALYFARPLISSDAIFCWLAAALAVGGGIYLLWAGKGTGGKVFPFFRFGIGIGVIAAGFYLMPLHPAKEGLAFKPYSKEAVASAKAAGRPVLIDFTADWCVPCRELKSFTFTDERVRAKSGSFDAFAVDLTTVEPDEIDAKKDYNVLGVPTVILIGPDGAEKDRFTGFIDADEFLARLEKIIPSAR